MALNCLYSINIYNSCVENRWITLLKTLQAVEIPFECILTYKKIIYEKTGLSVGLMCPYHVIL